MEKSIGLAIGTAQFGLLYGISAPEALATDREASNILSCAFEAGVRRLDTAPAYGSIEERLSDLIRGMDFAVTSKIPSLQALPVADKLSAISFSIRQSRKRLGENLHEILFHNAQDLSAPEGRLLWEHARKVCDEFNLSLGLSGYDPSDVVSLEFFDDVDACQLPGNALDQRVSSASALKTCEVTLRSIFLQGLLLLDPAAAREKMPGAARPLEAWERWLARNDLTRVEGALAAARHLNANYLLFGVQSEAQIREILLAWQVGERDGGELAIEDLAVIDPRNWGT